MHVAFCMTLQGEVLFMEPSWCVVHTGSTKHGGIAHGTVHGCILKKYVLKRFQKLK